MHMKKFYIMKQLTLMTVIIFLVNQAVAQVGIGTTSPNDNASLELGETDKGLMINRMTTLQRTTVLQPNLGIAEQGLFVFDTDLGQLMFWKGTEWVTVTSGSISGGGTSGNLAIWGPGNTLTDHPNLYWWDVKERLGIGTTVPDATLSVAGVEETALEVKTPVSSITGHLVNFERTVEPTSGSDLLQLKSPGGGATDDFQFLECQYGEQVMARINGNGHINATSLGAGTEYPTARITVDDNLWDVLLDIRQNNNPSVTDYMVNFEKTVIPYAGIDLVRMALPSGSPNDAQFLEFEKGGTELVQVNANGDIIVKNGGNIYVKNNGNYYAQNGGDFISTAGKFIIQDNSNVTMIEQGINTSGSLMNFYNEDYERTIYIRSGDNVVSDGGMISLYASDGAEKVTIDGNYSDGGRISLKDETGINKIILEANGTGGDARITTDELLLKGGSDFAELFSIEQADDDLPGPEPGMVLCISEDAPGQLCISGERYDKKVAGVISGAGGIKPGMIMGAEGTIAFGEHPVALSGRVYVKTCNENGPVEPGDFLTTASRPGYAMKVTDHEKAHGAIIGKAMTALDEKEGLVLVLVSLQ
jgi:hypothetical protein